MTDRDRILGIETSCDETAAAVVSRATDVMSSVVSSQIDLHAAFGGVVPEVASRAHLESLNPVVERALADAGVGPERVDAVACTVGPGLIGALLVGVSAAKAVSLAWDVPFIGVNHLEAHLYSSFLDHGDVGFPLVVLLVSAPVVVGSAVVVTDVVSASSPPPLHPATASAETTATADTRTLIQLGLSLGDLRADLPGLLQVVP